MFQLVTEWLPFAAVVVYALSLPFGVWLVAEAKRSQASDRAGPSVEARYDD